MGMSERIAYKEYLKDMVKVFNRAYVGGAGPDSILLKIYDQAGGSLGKNLLRPTWNMTSPDKRGQKHFIGENERKALWQRDALDAKQPDNAPILSATEGEENL
jgi:hypothetical protein